MEKQISRGELRPHGHQQIELKTRYPLRKRRKTRYEMDLFISTPHQLGLDAQRYGSEGLYRDMKAYTRYTIDEVPLRQLMGKDKQASPILRLEQLYSSNEALTEKQEQKVLFELRSLSNFFSTQIKHAFRRDKRTILQKESGIEGIKDRVRMQLHDIITFTSSYRKLMERCKGLEKNSNILQAFSWADEYISLTTERIMMYYFQLFKKNYPSEDIQGDISRIAQQEKQRRIEQGYLSAAIGTDNRSREIGLERESLLKKWSQSVLYLSSHGSKVEKGLVQIFAGAAAAIAMAVAVMFTFFADTWFSIYSLPWALVIIVSYILKDRIKEGFRGLFVRILPRFISDRTENLVDQRKNEIVGKSRNLVKFVKEKDLPEQIQLAVQSQQDELSKTQPESNIIWLKKTILLRSGKLLREHSKFNSITEIIRLSLEDFFEHMDHPKKSICSVDQDGNLEPIAGNRVYHCDIFIKLADDTDKQERVFWYDMVLTQKGLLRIEEKNIRMEEQHD